MKELCLTVLTALFCMIISNGVQAQTAQPKLDQLKLAQAMFGPMQHIISKDSLEISESQQYGNAFVQNVYLVVKGKKSFRYGTVTVYSPKEDKFKSFWFRPNGTYSTFISSFTAENKWSANSVQNFNPEKVLGKSEMILETPTNMTAIFYKPDGTKGGEYKWTKVK
jgi:hypothetical protein